MKKTFKILFPLIIILHLFMGIIWLTIMWSILWSLLWLMTSSVNWVIRFRQMTYLVYPLLLIGVIAAAIFFKTLIFGIYEIPTGSMEQTLVPGDIVWVNNTTYGPRLPYSPYEISWVNVLVWWIQGRNADMTKHWWNYERLKGYSKPRHNDVAVFNHPEKGEVYIKRMVALPGDTLQIVDGSLFVNGLLRPASDHAQFYSKISFQNKQVAHFILDSLNLQSFHQNKIGFYNGFLTNEQTKSLNQHREILYVRIDPHRADTAWQVYPWVQSLNWTIDNYGPYILPYKGMTISRNSRMREMYGHLIGQESQAERVDSVYCFEHDYFFMMGDNFHDSEDSRYYGPVKEELLIGKASFILFSKSKKNYKMDRLFRKVK